MFFFAVPFQVKDMLAERDIFGVSPLGMAARSGSKDFLEHVLSVIRQEFQENEARCHSVWRTGHTRRNRLLQPADLPQET